MNLPVDRMTLDELEWTLRRAIKTGRITGDHVGKAWGFIRAKTPKTWMTDWARDMVRELRRPDPIGPLIDEEETQEMGK